jgi:hypothetical protein
VLGLDGLDRGGHVRGFSDVQGEDTGAGIGEVGDGLGAAGCGVDGQFGAADKSLNSGAANAR